jgi:methylglutaconyl-CoA hydratase
MTESGVILRREGPVAELILHNPARHNALSRQVVEDLAAAAGALATDRHTRVVIVHGGDSPAFCAGADLKERQTMDEPQVFATVHRLRETVNLLARLPMPTIAAIHGMALGGGCELALACDLRVMSEDGRIGLSEVAWGIIPGAGGCVRLPRLIGPARAKELIFTARRLTAAEALSLGLVNRVVPREALLTTARELAAEIAAHAPLAVRAAKRAIQDGLEEAQALALEWEAYQSIIPTADRLEGLRAFAEKRPPVYRGE